MKNKFLLAALLLAVIITGTSCKKDHTGPGGNFNTPATPAPAGLEGYWSSGYQSLTDLYNVYTGEYIGNKWVSGKLFKFTSDGKNAEFYYSLQTPTMQAATKAVGTIAFDEGSTADEGVFTFYAGWAHYNGWGTTNVNRDATKQELSNNLSGMYSYKWDGQYLRISPGEPPVDPYASSFSKLQ